MDSNPAAHPAPASSIALPGARVFHALDVENLVGTPNFSATEAGLVYGAYDRVAPHGAVDQLVIATSHYAAPSAWFGFPSSARRLVRSGLNGADHALLEVLERESIAARFDHVILGSGDGIFAFAAAALQRAGCGVTVVTRRSALSRHLRLAVRDVRYLDLGSSASVIDHRLSVA
jgi:NYN domain